MANFQVMMDETKALVKKYLTNQKLSCILSILPKSN